MTFSQGASIAAANSNIDGEEIRAFDFGYNGAPEGDREAGPYNFSFTNTQPIAADVHEILFVRISVAHQAASKAQVIAAIDRRDFCLAGCFFDVFAGFAFAIGGTTVPGHAYFARGRRFAYFCAVPEPDGTPHYKLGMFGTFWAK